MLAPVLGHRGVAALYRRALSLSVRTYPFLGQAQGTSDPQTFERLHAVLAHQSVAEAIAASHGMVTTFQALLTSLIGPMLTDRLLGKTLQAAYNAPSRENDAE